MYVLKKGALYVARPGSDRSYTPKIENAQKFSTREEAERNMCPGNEHVVPLRLVWGE